MRARPDIVAALWNSKREYLVGMGDGSPQDDQLPLYELYECHVCHCRKESYRGMYQHVKGAHLPDEYERSGYDLIPAQTWFCYVPGGMGVWWRVKPTPIPSLVATNKASTQRGYIPDLLTERYVVGTGLRDDLNPFLQRTG